MTHSSGRARAPLDELRETLAEAIGLCLSEPGRDVRVVGALAARQVPDASGNYEFPASIDDAIEMYRGTFRELDHILDHNQLRGTHQQAGPAPETR